MATDFFLSKFALLVVVLRLWLSDTGTGLRQRSGIYFIHFSLELPFMVSLDVSLGLMFCCCRLH